MTRTGAKTFSAAVDTAGLDSLLDQLGEVADDAVRPSAQAGSQVLYDEVKRNVAGLGRKTGNLDASIYQKFSPEKSLDGKAVYNISWNHKKAPHGHLVEYGYLQRYRYRPDGMGPMVRPGMDGQRKPGRRASQAEKDAYYVTLPTPKQVPAKAFVRRAESAFDRAYKAAEDELVRRVAAKAGAA
ncbi:HK97 gp10 family phage protein [Acidovorax sp. NCPPB 3576]|uniref:HK97 gp10 family phage protein n=1 Tax=Acidovorax sp. NCPPB 3576 TaxID=2940488 RepID=UPI002349904C|nr:HK97 gp10 family phage protein [Acidovorax sp. NCPPB 3576]WCM86651.1 HK97 gp10 family phage protein [Acidovorax sp. NCPPB 3576]WCM88844.1 HK97 gp10 family phage protein [Acidovorax sp. NCPPB 3576]